VRRFELEAGQFEHPDFRKRAGVEAAINASSAAGLMLPPPRRRPAGAASAPTSVVVVVLPLVPVMAMILRGGARLAQRPARTARSRRRRMPRRGRCHHQRFVQRPGLMAMQVDAGKGHRSKTARNALRPRARRAQRSTPGGARGCRPRARRALAYAQPARHGQPGFAEAEDE
jgi:hypothetical protein